MTNPNETERNARLQELAAQANALRAQAADAQRQLQSMRELLDELAATRQTLDALPQAGESLVPLGGGAFTKAKFTRPSRVLIDIGAGVIVEKSADEARSLLQQRTGDVEKLAQQLEAGLQALQKEMGGLARQAAQYQ